MPYPMMQGIYGWGKVWEITKLETREAVCKELVRDKEGREEIGLSTSWSIRQLKYHKFFPLKYNKLDKKLTLELNSNLKK